MPQPALKDVEFWIFDLDNTLYDWVAWYSRAFYRMLDGAALRGSIPRERLLREMQKLYQVRQGLEQPEALLHARARAVHGVADGAEHRRQPALHVVRAATDEPVALDARDELRGRRRHDVEVPVEDDRGTG